MLCMFFFCLKFEALIRYDTKHLQLDSPEKYFITFLSVYTVRSSESEHTVSVIISRDDNESFCHVIYYYVS